MIGIMVLYTILYVLKNTDPWQQTRLLWELMTYPYRISPKIGYFWELGYFLPEHEDTK